MTSSAFNPSLDGPRLAPLSGGAAEQLVVILHGYGADGTDLIDLGRAWQQALPDAAFVAPNAPEPLPFEAFGGRQWFALEERTPREYEIGAEAAQPVLDRFLDAELNSVGLNDAALALVGFSQGAMMTFQAGLRRKTPPACLMAYSGLLPETATLPILPAPPPTLIVHGVDDDVVPAYHLEVARTALVQAGVTVQAHCLNDLGHGIDERGLILGRQFLEKAFL
jgi:phospholipase/carboxylesterase